MTAEDALELPVSFDLVPEAVFELTVSPVMDTETVSELSANLYVCLD